MLMHVAGGLAVLGHVGLLVLLSMLQLPLRPWGAQGLLGWPPWPSLGDFLRCLWALKTLLSHAVLSPSHPSPMTLA